MIKKIDWAAIKKARIKAHDAIRDWQRATGAPRGKVYFHLKHYFGFDVHIRNCDVEMCEKIVAFCKRQSKK